MVVSGNSAYVTEEAFKTYANYKCFWVFSNDEGEGNTNTNTTVTSNDTVNTVNYTRYVATKSANLNVRDNPNGNIVGSLAKGTQVTVYEVSGNWSRIGNNQWVSTSYLSSTAVTSSTSSTSYTTTVGSYYRLKSKTTLYAKSGMSGTSYNYLAQTQIKVVSHYSSSIDYIYVVKTRKVCLLLCISLF